MLAIGFPALALSIACAVAYSASDYFRKAMTENCGTALVLFVMTAGQIPILALWWAAGGETRLTMDYWLPGLIAAAAGLAANLMFIEALRRSPLSLMIPLMAMIPVLTLVSGFMMLGEQPTARQIVGIILVTMGLLAVYMPPAAAGLRFDVTAAWRNVMREPGTRFMCGVMVLWSVTPALDKICVAESSVGVHGVVQLLMLWAALGIWLGVTGGRRAFAVPKASLKPLAGAALTAGLAYAFQLAAYQMTMVAFVEVFKRVVGLIGALILGRILLHEPVTHPKLIGIGVMAVGLPLVILS